MKTVLELEDLANRAVKAALNQQWQQAVELNQEILSENSENIEATNRIARAYQELGNIDDAKKSYQQVLSIDPYNSIAQKNLAKLEQGATAASSAISKELFLEEPGKTRSTAISKPKTAKISQYSSGEELQLMEKDGLLALNSNKGETLGYLNDELSNHLLKLMALGNKYTAHLLNTSENPQVFLREVVQSSQAAKFISFTRTTSASNHFSSPKTLHSDDSLPIDSSISDEDLDNWDNDDSSDDLGLDDDSDDFDSVSFEQMRDEEDGNYPARDEY